MNSQPPGTTLNGKSAQEFPLGSESLHSLVAKLGGVNFVVLADGDSPRTRRIPPPPCPSFPIPAEIWEELKCRQHSFDFQKQGTRRLVLCPQENVFVKPEDDGVQRDLA